MLLAVHVLSTKHRPACPPGQRITLTALPLAPAGRRAPAPVTGRPSSLIWSPRPSAPGASCGGTAEPPRANRRGPGGPFGRLPSGGDRQRSSVSNQLHWRRSTRRCRSAGPSGSTVGGAPGDPGLGRAGRRPVRPGPIGPGDLLPNHRTGLAVFGVGQVAVDCTAMTVCRNRSTCDSAAPTGSSPNYTPSPLEQVWLAPRDSAVLLWYQVIDVQPAPDAGPGSPRRPERGVGAAPSLAD